jgi:hypothetical protein
MFPTFKRLHIVDHFYLFVSGVILAIICGGVMNAIDGMVSTPYFQWIFYYPGGSPNWSPMELYWHTVGEGLREGMWFGVIMSAFFMFFVACSSKGSSGFLFCFRYLLKIASVASLCWVIGGIVGIVTGLLLPNFLSFLFKLGASQIDRYRLLWVMFSIWGVYLGNIVALILGCLWFLRDWKATVKIIS